MEMAQELDTQHAILIPLEYFAQEIGLISDLEAVKLNHKVYNHTPQAKVLEFFVAILSGKPFPKDAALSGRLREKNSVTTHLPKGHLARTAKTTVTTPLL